MKSENDQQNGQMNYYSLCAFLFYIYFVCDKFLVIFVIF